MDLFADIPSSPLSSAPSGLASRSPSPQPIKAANVGRKRKVADPAPAKSRATRRKTGDDFPMLLTEIREQIVLPKVRKAAARKAVSKKDVAAAKTQTKAEAAAKAAEATEIQDDASKGMGSRAVDEETAQLESNIAEPVTELTCALLPETTNLQASEGKEVEPPVADRTEYRERNEIENIEDEEVPGVENKAESASKQKAIPAVMQEVELVEDEAHQQIDEEETTKDVEGKAPRAATEKQAESITAMVSKVPEDEEEDEFAVDKLTKSLEDAIEEPSITVRSSRRRVAPTKLADDYSSPAKAITATSKRKSQLVRGNWSAEHLLTNPKSKLATCNLPELLSQERAWTLLSRADQLDLISMLPPFIRSNLPDEFPDDMEIPNILRQTMKSNNSFQADVRFFQEDLAAGRYDPQWQKDAQEAMNKRAAGAFDSCKEQNREEFWGQKQKVDWHALSGDSAQYSLGDLAKAGLFEIGDVWALRVSRNGMVVDKEAKVCDPFYVLRVEVLTCLQLIDITPDFSLCFSFPPGQHKFSAPSNGQDVEVQGIKAPNTLCYAILKEDGRLATVRVANAWRDFRCTRRHQDMGSLFDVRELYHSRQSD